MTARKLRPIPLTVAVMALLLTVAGCGGEPPAQSISAAALAERIGDGTPPAIFDVRTPAEYADGHIPGAINLPHTEVSARADEFAVYRDREVVVYCRSGRRAAMAEADLAEAGFANVRDLEGHMQQWQAQGFPVAAATAPE